MNAFIDEHRAAHGVEPICSALQVAPSAYRRYAARRRDPTLLPARAVENQCYVAGVNRVGTDGRGVAYAGDSGLHDYLGQTLANLGEAPGHCTVTLGLDALQRYREKFPAYLDADPFQLL